MKKKLQIINQEKLDNIRSKVKLSTSDNWIVFTYKNDIIRGNFDNLKDRMYVKKNEYQSFEMIGSNDSWDNSIELKFNLDFIDKEYIELVYDYHIDLIVNNKCKTFEEALNTTFNFFANEIEKNLKSKIWGDIGEAIFILKSYEIAKLNLINNIHVQDNGLYDFSFKNGKYIEIKTTSPDKNEIVLTNCQIDYVKDRAFIVVKFKEIENATTIIDIYDLIKHQVGSLSAFLQSKYKQYMQLDILNKLTVNLEKVEIWKLTDESVPVFEIKNQSALKKSKFYLDVTDNLESFEKYIIEQKNNLVS